MAKLAVISDIHGNYKALEAFLAYIEQYPVDGVVCLGDYVTDSPYPERTMELIYRMQEAYPCFMIRGNRENYLLDNAVENQGWRPSSSNGALYYTAMHLREQDLEFFRNLPEECEVRAEGVPEIYICHGTPGKVRGNVCFEEGLRERSLECISQNYLFGGHSHRQEIYHYRGKTYLNPGSLGLAIDGVGRRAQFAIAETSSEAGALVIHFNPVSIPYDVDAFLRDFTESGLDELALILNRAVKKTLVTGVNYFFKGIVEAQRETGCPIPEIPESVWNEVAKRLEL